VGLATDILVNSNSTIKLHQRLKIFKECISMNPFSYLHIFSEDMNELILFHCSRVVSQTFLRLLCERRSCFICYSVDLSQGQGTFFYCLHCYDILYTAPTSFEAIPEALHRSVIKIIAQVYKSRLLYSSSSSHDKPQKLGDACSRTKLSVYVM